MFLKVIDILNFYRESDTSDISKVFGSVSGILFRKVF